MERMSCSHSIPENKTTVGYQCGRKSGTVETQTVVSLRKFAVKTVVRARENASPGGIMRTSERSARTFL
jgi:hypothetical protein